NGSGEFAPVQTSGDHQMNHQPQVVLQADGNPFADPAQRRDLEIPRVIKGRRDRPEKEWVPDFYVDQLVAQDALLEGFEVKGDVRQFGHALFSSSRQRV